MQYCETQYTYIDSNWYSVASATLSETMVEIDGDAVIADLVGSSGGSGGSDPPAGSSGDNSNDILGNAISDIIDARANADVNTLIYDADNFGSVSSTSYDVMAGDMLVITVSADCPPCDVEEEEEEEEEDEECLPDTPTWDDCNSVAVTTQML